MRVLHVVPSYLPATRYGGPIFSVHSLCAAQARQGHDIHVFTTNVDGSADSAVPLCTPVALGGVSVWYFPVPGLRRLYWAPRMRAALEREVPRFDIVHAHSVFLWPTWAAARAARKHGVPYIVAPRGMLVKDLVRRKSMLPKTAWISLVERRNMKNAAGIHVTSATEAEELARFSFVLPRVYEVPNGFSADEPASPADPLPACVEAALDGDKPVLLYVGRISWKKGLDRLIRALAQVPGAVLLVAGNDEEGYVKKLVALAENERARDRIVFAGPVYGAAKAALYRRAALFVLPSYSESFGNVVIEAMAAGCPVIVTPEVGASSIVAASGGGTVVAGEPDALAGAIRKLLGSGALRQEMGERGRNWILARYSWQSVAERMLEVYQAVIAGRRSRDMAGSES